MISLVAQKELEWRNALNEQIVLLEESVQKRETELIEERKQKQQLKDDFKYNLRLLQERDQELESTEKERYLLQQKVSENDNKLSTISMQLDETRQKLYQETLAKNQIREHFESLLDAKARDLDFLKHDKELEVSRFKDEQYSLRKKAELECIKLKSELDEQKKELMALCDKRLREVKADYEQKMSKMNEKVLEAKLKEEMLEKETSNLEKSRKQLLKESESRQSVINKLESTNKELKFRLESDISILKNENSRLDEYTESLKSDHKRHLERLERKIADLEIELQEKDTVNGKIKQSVQEERSSLRKQLAELVDKLHDKEAEFLKKMSDFEVSIRGKDALINELRDEVAALTEKLEDNSTDISKTVSFKDVEIERLKKSLTEVTNDLQQKLNDIDWYKKELSSSTHRANALENIKSQLEAEFQLKTEELRGLQYEKSEVVIQSLTESRDSALLKIDELENTLAQKQAFIQSLLRDRNMALESLKVHGVTIDRQLEVKQQSIERQTEVKIRELESQNDVLKNVIKQMRSELEHMDSQPPSAAENLPMPPINDGRIMSRSIHELSTTIGKLRQEKTDLLAQCRKNQARLQHLESQISESKGDAKLLETTCEQLRYDLSAKERHHTTEISNIRRRCQELESQLDESQREADEYYKANIAQGKTVDQLQEELIAYKSRMESAGRGPPSNEVNFGAQELYIQQLQDEIQRLTENLQTKAVTGDVGEDNNHHSADNQKLVSKLRLAANQIKKLAQEKQVLVDLSNKLRAELRTKRGATDDSKTRRAAPEEHYPNYHRKPITYSDGSNILVKDAVGDLNTKLAQLEKMQYYITKDNLSTRRVDASPLRNSSDIPEKDTSLKAAVRPVTPSALKQSLVMSSLGGESLKDVWKLLDDSSVHEASEPATLAVVGKTTKLKNNRR